jgi:hypothetical protein
VLRPHIREETVFSITGSWRTECPHLGNETKPPSLTSYKTQLEWIKDLDVRPKVMKLLEENGGNASRHWKGQGYF